MSPCWTLAIPAAAAVEQQWWQHGVALVVHVNDKLDMPYNSYYMPNVTGLEHVDHVDSRRHDAVLHVDIAVVDYD